MEQYRVCDVLLHVVRCFEDEQLTHYYETIDPVRDCELVTQELLMADLQVVESHLIKLYV